MRIESLEELKVWNYAIELAQLVYGVSGEIKDFGFRDQIQRATVSIPNNIAEGFGRQPPKKFIRFLYYARGSSMELRSMLHLEKDIGNISTRLCQQLLQLQERINKMIWELMSYLMQISNK